MDKEEILKHKYELIMALAIKYAYPIVTAHQNPKKVFCKNCKHHDTNFWGYDECWLFNKKIDGSVTSETAERERTAILLNSENFCYYFSEKRKFRIFINKIKKSFKLFFYSK